MGAPTLNLKAGLRSALILLTLLGVWQLSTRPAAVGPPDDPRSMRVTNVDQLGHLDAPNASTHSGDGTPPAHSDASHAWPRSSRHAAE